jgi:hypothetical protein
LILDAIEFGPVESEALAQRRRSIRAMQDENGLSDRSLDVNVRRSIIVRVNGHAQPIKAENGRHYRLVTEPKRFGKWIAALPVLAETWSVCRLRNRSGFAKFTSLES